MPQRPYAHRSFRIELVNEMAYAQCTCGWQSEPALNAGMAGAMWDRHIEEVVAEDVSGQ